VKLHGKDIFPMAGEYTGQVMLDGVDRLPAQGRPPELLPARCARRTRPGPRSRTCRRPCPIRPPGFCTGCPERPIFAAMKLVQKELGKHQIAADIGCHLFASLPPFEIGGATMGYGLGPASNAAFDGGGEKRPISIIGDGGFWHNGLSSSIGNMVFNKSDGVTSSSTTTIPRPPAGRTSCPRAPPTDSKATNHPIAKAVRASASNGCARSTAPMTWAACAMCCARR
jgi:indolepyruvate ferredoxin oxidoreductase, alpha subunit